MCLDGAGECVKGWVHFGLHTAIVEPGASGGVGENEMWGTEEDPCPTLSLALWRGGGGGEMEHPAEVIVKAGIIAAEPVAFTNKEAVTVFCPSHSSPLNEVTIVLVTPTRKAEDGLVHFTVCHNLTLEWLSFVFDIHDVNHCSVSLVCTQSGTASLNYIAIHADDAHTANTALHTPLFVCKGGSLFCAEMEISGFYVDGHPLISLCQVCLSFLSHPLLFVTSSLVLSSFFNFTHFI